MTDLIHEDCEFYMVWTKTGHKPRFIHGDEGSAVAEAERLARLHPGKKFIVLKGYRKMVCPQMNQEVA